MPGRPNWLRSRASTGPTAWTDAAPEVERGRTAVI
jgi:hypothetical protein